MKKKEEETVVHTPGVVKIEMTEKVSLILPGKAMSYSGEWYPTAQPSLDQIRSFITEVDRHLDPNPYVAVTSKGIFATNTTDLS